MTTATGPWILLGSFDAPDGADLHALMRAARSGDPDATAEVLARVDALAPAAWPTLVDAVVVPVPGHLPGADPALVEAAARRIAARRSWIVAVGALRRRSDAPEAKLGGPRSASAEAATLAWTPPPGGGAVVLVDDVVRGGATLAACERAIAARGDTRPVRAIVLAAVHAPAADR